MEMQRINEDTIKVMISNDELSERGVDVLSLLGDEDRIESFLYGILEEIDADKEFKDTSAVTFQVVPNKSGLEMFIKNNHLTEKDIDKNNLSSGKISKEKLSELTDNGKDNNFASNSLGNISNELKDKINDFNELPLTMENKNNILNYLRQLKNKIDSLEDKNENHMVNSSISQLVNAAKNMDRDRKTSNHMVNNIILKLSSFDDLVGMSKALNNNLPETYLYKYENNYYLYMSLPEGYNNDDILMFQRDVAVALEYSSKSNISLSNLEDKGKSMISINALQTIKKYF
ncbi:adaptor protein MecA [Apilactobacillus quenuiae]|uniref:adaptor protein MecA n=1 Tax=Apilactobacillus quenuiae TaxID=2008377 RepID=UPI000D01445B|nr:adaptor protein MecA [Apilactobacillus quenuiae]